MRDRRSTFFARYGHRPLESGKGFRLQYAVDGTIVDRFGRSLEQVRAAAEFATALAERSRTLALDVEESAETGRLELDRIAGHRFKERYLTNNYLLTKVSERDNEIVRVLEEATAEDALFRRLQPHVIELEEARQHDAAIRAREDVS